MSFLYDFKEEDHAPRQKKVKHENTGAHPRFFLNARPMSVWWDVYAHMDEQLALHPPRDWSGGLSEWSGRNGSERFRARTFYDLTREITKLYGIQLSNVAEVFYGFVAARDYTEDPVSTLKVRWPPMTNLFESTDRLVWSDVYFVMREGYIEGGWRQVSESLLFPLFDKAASTTAVTLAIGFMCGARRLHAFGIVMWFDAATLHAAVYDSFFSVRHGKESGNDTIIGMEMALNAWSVNNGKLGCKVHHVGRMCMATPEDNDRTRVHCVQYIVNANLCTVYAIHWLHMVAKRLNGGFPNEDVLKAATEEVGGGVTGKSEVEVLARLQIRIASLAANILAAFIEDNKDPTDMNMEVVRMGEDGATVTTLTPMPIFVESMYKSVDAVRSSCLEKTGIDIQHIPLAP